MRHLYARIAAGVVLALVAGWVASTLMAPRLNRIMNQSLGDQLLGSGLRWVAQRIDDVPKDEWADRLSEARRELTVPLAIIPSTALPGGVAKAVSNAEPTLASDPANDRTSIYIPLDAGAYFLVAGPLPTPPVAPLVPMGLVFALVLTATASAAVGIPLVRRIRSLRHAIGELGDGNWDVRLDTNAEGALRELAESINSTAAQLQRQFQEREALLQVVSHEIGTPLARMRFQVELLDSALQAPEHRARLRALSDDLDELDGLSTELVGWMEADAQAGAARTFAVGPVIESLIELERPGDDGLPQIRLVVPPDATVRADQRQFQRAIENLLKNARRYAQERVLVEARVESAHVVVEIRDDGPGIPRDQWARVLEPFVRIDGSPSRAHRGLGLGLAIVRRVVEAHGGAVSVGEAPEGGTQVRTSWPRA